MKIEDRIRAIESRVLGPKNESPSVSWELCSTFELMHLDGVINNKWQLPGSEISRIALRALEREAAGMSEAEVLAHFDPIEKEIAKSFSRFPLQLGERHNASKLPLLNEYSLLDLTAEDADVLVDLAGTATSINEIESAAAAVSRLWLRGRQFTTEMFASLVLRGTVVRTRLDLPI